MPVTHQDIAEKLGITRSVVTHVLHGSSKSRVREDTRREIEIVARQMGYTPRNRTTHSIAYVVPIDNQHPIEKSYMESENVLSLRMERVARAAGYRLTVIGMSEGDDLATLRGMLNAKNADGVIFSCWHGGVIREILPPEVPWVLIADADDIPGDVDVVTTDYHATGKTMAGHLIARGHQRLGLIMSEADIKVHRDVKRGTFEALRLAGLAPDSLHLLEVVPIAEIIEPLCKIVRQRNAPTAWIASTSGRTIGAMLALYSLGLKIPDDVSLASVMDSPQFSSLPCPITSSTAMGQPIAERAVARLLEKMKNPGLPPRYERLASQIVERPSVVGNGA